MTSSEQEAEENLGKSIHSLACLPSSSCKPVMPQGLGQAPPPPTLHPLSDSQQQDPRAQAQWGEETPSPWNALPPRALGRCLKQGSDTTSCPGSGCTPRQLTQPMCLTPQGEEWQGCQDKREVPL